MPGAPCLVVWLALVALVRILRLKQLVFVAAVVSWLVAWAVMAVLPVVSPWIRPHLECVPSDC